MQISKIKDTSFKSNLKNNNIEPKNNNSSLSKTIGMDELNKSPLAQLNKTNINFCGMKKSQFSGIDLIVVNKLTKEKGLNIQSKNINTNSDFQNYCQNILDSEYYGEDNIKKLSKSMDEQAQLQKERILKDWINYIKDENDAYNPAIQLLIMSSITNNLNENTNYLPPVLDKRKTADTIAEITEKSKTIKNYEPNFNKIYRNNLQQSIFEKETQLDPSLSGWIIIPSKANDPDNFDDNVKKLQILSHNSWCTKTYNAEPYLSKGDFHVYIEHGKPKLGVRFEGNEIQEIQGELNNSKIPQGYLNIAKEYVKENNFKQNHKTINEFKQAEEIKKIVAEIKSEIGEDVFKNKEYDKILPYFGIEVTKDKDGMLILDRYSQPKEFNGKKTNYLSFGDIGIDENDLFKHIKEIKGNADFFENITLTSLGNLQSIGGDADFEYSKVTDLGELQSIGGNADFDGSKVTNLGKLQNIGGNADFDDSEVTDLGNIKNVVGRITISPSSDKLKQSIINFYSQKIENINKTDYENILKALGYKVEKDKDQMLILDSFYELTSFPVFEALGIDENDIFKHIKEIKGSADFTGSTLTSLGNLLSIGGYTYFQDSKMTDLGNLVSIGGDAYFNGSNVVDLGNLQSIGGGAYFGYSKVTDLGHLYSIGSDAYFNGSNVVDLGKLQNIGGNVHISYSNFSEEDFKNIKIDREIKKN